jgi:hypothetical protein
VLFSVLSFPRGQNNILTEISLLGLWIELLPSNHKVPDLLWKYIFILFKEDSHSDYMWVV